VHDLNTRDYTELNANDRRIVTNRERFAM